MIDLKEIDFSYDAHKKNLKIKDFQIQQGEFIVLCGKSGCGKSTMLKILNGLIPELYCGELAVEGEIFGQEFMDKEFTDYVRDIGVVFQNPKTQFFTNNVYSELAFALENYGIPREDILSRVEEVVQQFSLESFIGKSMFDLSGGQKQLIAFASASMLEHRLFLLDEPSSNLDQETIEKLSVYLRVLKESGMTVIVAEHRLYYLSELVDRYFMMEEGEMIAEFQKEELQALEPQSIQALGLRSLQPIELNKELVVESAVHPEALTLRITDVAFHYKKQPYAVEIPDLSISSEHVIGLVGSNGAGKSTFIKLLSGLLRPKQGKIVFQGQVMKAKQLVMESFVVMQDVNLQLFFETVEKEISVHSVEPEKLEEVVEMLHLKNLLQRHPQTLSGGEKQRVAIASAVLSGKKMIFFDEPTSGLDRKHMHEVSQTIHWLKQKNIFVFIITHDKEFLKQTCQRVLRLEQGRISEDFWLIQEK